MASPLSTRSPITATAPTGRRPGALRLTDCSAMAKALIRADPDGVVASALGVRFGFAGPGPAGALVIGSAPGEWLLLAAPGTATDLVAAAEAIADGARSAGLTSVLDVTHGYAVVRLTGGDAAELLARLCPIDLSDDVTPNGAAFRSLLASLAVGVARTDRDGKRSYLLYVDRSYGQSLWGMLVDVGADFGLAIDGGI